MLLSIFALLDEPCDCFQFLAIPNEFPDVELPSHKAYMFIIFINIAKSSSMAGNQFYTQIPAHVDINHTRDASPGE